MADKELDVGRMLPLPEATFHILLALVDGDRHGYGIIQDVRERTEGQVKLGAGTLYRTIQRLLEQGLIEETRDRPPPDEDDDRRRYYRLRPLGREAAAAELARLSGLVRLARSRGLSTSGS